MGLDPEVLDPGTVSKMVILPQKGVLLTLLEHMDIENIPKRFGGTFEYEQGMPMALDKTICNALTWLPPAQSSLPVGPMKWIQGEQGTRVVVVVCTDGGNPRRDEVASLSFKRRGSAIALDYLNMF